MSYKLDLIISRMTGVSKVIIRYFVSSYGGNIRSNIEQVWWSFRFIQVLPCAVCPLLIYLLLKFKSQKGDLEHDSIQSDKYKPTEVKLTLSLNDF